MYKKIRRHPGVLSKYADQLVSENVITRAEFQVGQWGYQSINLLLRRR